eukprot:c23064_g1_i1 orf=361-1545(+)
MSWLTWWNRRKGRGLNKIESIDSENEEMKERVALIVGVTGIVGNSLVETLSVPDIPGAPWKVYGIARKPKPAWFNYSSTQYIQCDVLNRKDTLEKISSLTDVTHLFWVAWISRDSEQESCECNEKMLRNVLDALMPNAEHLEHICLQTGTKHYVGPFNVSWKEKSSNDPPYREDMPRLPVQNFYYTLEDTLFEYVAKKEGLTWSVHRPSVIFGFSPGSFMNLLGSIAVYATICKKEGLPFKFTGSQNSWQQFQDASDAELIAEHEIWAATDPDAKNEAFNITNGDVFNWKRLWPLVAEKFGLEVPPYTNEPESLAKMMGSKGPVWDEIVKENGLVSTKLEEVGTWWFADLMLNMTGATAMSMNKSRDFGFFGFRNSETSALYWIDKMREKKIIP